MNNLDRRLRKLEPSGNSFARAFPDILQAMSDGDTARVVEIMASVHSTPIEQMRVMLAMVDSKTRVLPVQQKWLGA